MNLEYHNPHDLHPNPWNSNVVSEENKVKLKESLDRLGAFKPIICRTLRDGRLQILGGFHRNEMSKELGYDSVPVFNLGEVSDTRAKEITLADNARYGKDDSDKLDALIKELATAPDLATFLPKENWMDEISTASHFDDLDDDISDLLGDDTSSKAEDTARPEEGSEKPSERATEAKTHEWVKAKGEIEKVEEITEILKKVAAANDYTYGDLAQNLFDALYHVLVLEKR